MLLDKTHGVSRRSVRIFEIALRVLSNQFGKMFLSIPYASVRHVLVGVASSTAD